MSTQSDRDSIELLKKTAEGIRICMYCTDLGTKQQARPMSTAKVEDDGSIWFFTSTDHDVADFGNRNMVHLLYADNGDQKYLSVRGHATLIDDREKAKDLWNPILNAWFPKGVETPDLRLLRVQPVSGEYWEGASMIRTIFDAIRAKVTGEEGTYGEHEDLNL